MPTKNPRLSVTLEPALAAQLRRLSELTGNSQGALVAELLTDSSPVFQRVIDTLEAAQAAVVAAKGQMRGLVTVEVNAAQEHLEKQLGLMLDLGDQKSADLVSALESVKRRSRKEEALEALTKSRRKGPRVHRKRA